jgi:hypothetical protein
VSTLRSAIDELRAEDLASVADASLDDDLSEIERASAALEVERARRIVEVERRGSFRRDGHLSITAWLAGRLRLSFSAASRQVRQARCLRDLPAAGEALSSGEISRSAADMLTSARESDQEAFAESGQVLLDAARTLSISQLGRAIGYWRQLAEAKRDDDRRYERRGLHVSPTMGGMVRLDGDLDPETGQHVITAIRSVVDAWARNRDDPRRPTQLRADALGEICGGSSIAPTGRSWPASGPTSS